MTIQPSYLGDMKAKLSTGAILEAISKLPDWSFENEQLTKTYKFDSYYEGLVFANVIGYLAQCMNHHPDMLIGYQTVKVTLSTHDSGGVTDLDVALAGKIENQIKK